MTKREFTNINEYHYNRSHVTRWIASHLLRYKLTLFSYMLLVIATHALYSTIPVLAGNAFNVVLSREGGLNQLGSIALELLVVAFITGGIDLSARTCAEFLSERATRDARDELYVSLLDRRLSVG